MKYLSEENQQPYISSDFYIPNQARMEELRLILESEMGVPVSSHDAEEVATQLISLYECLARDRKILPEVRHEVPR